MFNTKDFTKKVELIPLDRIHVLSQENGWNKREIKSYQSLDLDATLATDGQRDTGALYKFSEQELAPGGIFDFLTQYSVKAGDYAPLKGNIRAKKMKDARDRGVIDPHTMKRDADGNVLPGSGSVFTNFRAEVYENLTKIEIEKLMSDHTAKPLTRVEGFLDAEKWFRQTDGLPGQEALVSPQLRTYFATTSGYKPESKSKSPLYDEKGNFQLDNYLKFRHGAYQALKDIAYGPTVMRDACVAQLRGEQSWPTATEVKECFKIYKDEKDADDKALRCQYNKDNPGPKFQARWAQILASVAAAADEGTRRKSTAMMNVDEVRNVVSNTSSLTGKLWMFVVQKHVSPEMRATLDDACTQLESGKIDVATYMATLTRVRDSAAAALAAAAAEEKAEAKEA